MTVLFIILGILMIAGGVSFMCTPLITFLTFAQFIVIMVGIYGIVGIVRAIRNKRFGLEFVFSILSIIFGAVGLFAPIISDSIMLYMSAAWFVLFGIVTIITAVTVVKATGSKIWILQLILGILGIIIGCYSFFNPLLLALTQGIMVGIFFIETGITMIVASVALKD